jgi:4-hydroxy-tetrahydrodipicolinate reductase
VRRVNIFVVGTGRLAAELLASLPAGEASLQVASWADKGLAKEKSVVVHAGSGRQLAEVISWCRETGSILVELATGSAIGDAELDFPAVLCPNTNILMLKFMSMLAQSGHLFAGHKIELTESHQASKTSTPGTAVDIAQALGLKSSDVLSVRDPGEQMNALHIPTEHLDRHAFHRVLIEDGTCSIAMETRVHGAAPYADGVARIIDAIRSNALENRVYRINEFIENGWL